MVIKPKREPHEGPCSYDPIFGVEKVKTPAGNHGLAIFCRCGKWEYVEPPLTNPQKFKGPLRLWPVGSKLPILCAAALLFAVVIVINSQVIRDLAVYPIRILMLGAAFLCARLVYRYLDPEWDMRKQQEGDKFSIDWRAFTAALLIFIAVGTLLEALPTHQMARSFAHESFDD